MVLKNPTKYEIGKTIVFFVRHGEREFIPGTPWPYDTPLNKNGIKQAREVADKFYKINKEIDVIYSSDLKRAKETAEIISKKLKRKFKIIPEFNEVNGVLEKNNFLIKDYLKHYIKFKNSVKKLDNILVKNKGKVIIIVAHGRIIRTILGNKLKIGMDKTKLFDYNNCHITKVRFDKTKIDYIHYFNSKELVH